MKREEKEITAAMNTRIYNGFGGWSIHKDGKLVYAGDWRANCVLPLREAYYQRQGKNRWVLIKTGMGFA